MEAKADLDLKVFEESYLTHAARMDNPDVLRFLIDQNPDLTELRANGALLRDLILNNYLKCAKLLVEVGIEIEPSTQGQTPLHLAIMTHNFKLINRVIEAKVEDINAQNYWGQTPLQLAILSGNSTHVQLLIEKGADINIQDQDLKC